MVFDADSKAITLEHFVRAGIWHHYIVPTLFFGNLVEKLVQDPVEEDLKDSVVHRFNSVETTTLISIEKYAYDRDDIAKLTLTYSQGLRLVKVYHYIDSSLRAY